MFHVFSEFDCEFMFLRAFAMRGFFVRHVFIEFSFWETVGLLLPKTSVY